MLIKLDPSVKLANDSTFLFEVSGVNTVDGDAVADYVDTVSFADHTAPTLGSVEYVNNNTAKVSFSEGMTTLAGSSVKIYDGGTDVTGAGLQSLAGIASNGDKEITIDLTNATVNKTYTVKVYGAMDLYGNFAGTQTFTVVKTNADNVDPTVTSVEATGLDTFKINFSEKVIVDPNTAANGYGDFSVGSLTDVLAVGTNVASVTPSADGKTLTVVLTATGKTSAGISAAGLQTVKVNNFYDTSENQQTTEFVKVINFAADTTAPAVTKTEVIGNTLYVTFDDSDVSIGAATNALENVTYVKDYIEYSVADFGTAVKYDPDGDTKTSTVSIDLSGQAAGVYSATLAADVVQDGVPNSSAAKAITFEYSPSTSTAKPKVVDSDNDASNGITGITYTAQAAATPNQIVLKFDKPVSASTALNESNYLIDGVAAFEDAIFVGDNQTVRLTLRDDAIAVDATRAFTIKDVQSTAGVAMNTITFYQAFTENVKPTLQSAKLLSANSIEVKFSEVMTATSLTAGTVKDFEVYVGGVKVEDIPVSSVAAGLTNDKYLITLATPLTATDLSKDIVVKLKSTTDAEDASSITNDAEGGESVVVVK